MTKLSRQTRQKQLLQHELDNMDSFFTGEELYEKVRKKHARIGLATVYRFLKDLRERRAVHSYMCDRRILYTKEKKSHCHFICEKCGKIEHFDVDAINFIKRNIKGEICHFQLDVSGVCKDCIANK